MAALVEAITVRGYHVEIDSLLPHMPFKFCRTNTHEWMDNEAIRLAEEEAFQYDENDEPTPKMCEKEIMGFSYYLHEKPGGLLHPILRGKVTHVEDSSSFPSPFFFSAGPCGSC